MTFSPPSSARILIVDDQRTNLEILELMLRPEGYHIRKALSGEEALKMAKQAPPDVVLLDIMMPEMDGFEVAERLRRDEATRNTPIVMVTALKDVPDRVRALEAGADDFLSKPVDRIELQARVKSLIKVKFYNDYMKNYQHELERQVAARTVALRTALTRLEKTMHLLEEASLDTIIRLSWAAEYKDEDTGAHILRMSHYASAVARRMGLGDKVAKWILYASPMHDVGKIGIPDRILLKPGPLDPDEWAVMKTHTLIGARILSGAKSGFLAFAEIIARTHHEKFDGSGYPDGLKGDKIPLAGQITAIADVFDALTSERPYKKPFSKEKSFDIIKEGRGGHFHPDVVDAFFAITDKIDHITELYRDDNPDLTIDLRHSLTL